MHMASRNLLTDEQAQSAGRAARALLDHGLVNDVSGQLVRVALETVCWTASYAPEASVELLRKCLVPNVVQEHGYVYLPAMTEHLLELAEASEDLALAVVTAIGTLQESRDDWVESGGRILSFRFNKYDLLATASHNLEKQFGNIIRKRPSFGAQIAIQVVDAHVRTHESNFAQPSKAYTFTFHGGEATLLPDGSYLWAVGTGYNEHETWFKIAKSFREFLVECAGSDEAAVDQVLCVFRDHATRAILWNQLLIAGIEAPSTLGVRLVDLLCSTGVLQSLETRVSSGKLLEAGYSHFSIRDRQRIETAIVSLQAPKDYGDYAEHIKPREILLGCLPKELIATDEARKLRGEIDSHGGAPGNDPPYEAGPGAMSLMTNG